MSSLKPGQMENIVISSILTGILTSECYFCFSKDIFKKPARLWIFIQFCLIAMRGYTVVLMSAIPSINCYLTATIGLTIFQLWIVALQMVLYLRAWAFSVTEISKKVLTVACVLLWSTILALRFYQVGTQIATSKDGEYCRTAQIGVNLTIPNFILLVISYGVLLLPFVHRAMHTYLDFENDKEEARKWLHLSITNCLCVSFIIFLELFARFISPLIPNITTYSGIMFSVINFLESNTVLFLLEDLKRKLLGAKPISFGGITSSSVSSKIEQTK